MAKPYSGQVEAQRERAAFRTGLWSEQLLVIETSPRGGSLPPWQQQLLVLELPRHNEAGLQPEALLLQGGGAGFGFVTFLMCVWGTWIPESEVSGWKLFYLDYPDQSCRSRQRQHGREAFILQTHHFQFLLNNLWQILCGLWELAPGLLYGSLQMCLK